MDFFEAVEKRFSFRGTYADKSVSEKDIRRILDAGIRAPRYLKKRSFSRSTRIDSFPLSVMPPSSTVPITGVFFAL